MGLDISAYSRLIPATESEDGIRVFAADPAFMPRLDGRAEGCYARTPETEELRFRAGSYSGYSDWRRELSRLIQGREPEAVWGDPQGPFAELIYFSDCEGAIGPITSAKLARDFHAHYAAVKAANPVLVARTIFRPECAPSEERAAWFVPAYEAWMRAFDLAAQDGFVIFC